MFKVLVVGCGDMGISHAMAYSQMANCRVVGLVELNDIKRQKLAMKLKELRIQVNQYTNFDEALFHENPDIVCIASYPETHADFAIKAMKFGAHVFLEKPIATNLIDALLVLEAVKETRKKLVVGMILRHHPSWQQFIAIAHKLGTPLVMRMNLNQQSSGEYWTTHFNLMKLISPIVDCGVHYVDVMCQMTNAKPISVYASGVKLINVGTYNYGMLQVKFEDGSIGWYEVGWGPMISTNAHFIKDVIGPKGCASIVPNYAGHIDSSNIDGHTSAENILLHHSQTDELYNLVKEDQLIKLNGALDHQALCIKEQQYLINAIIDNFDLTAHIVSAIDSLAIVLAADDSVRTGNVVTLSEW